MPQRTTWSLSIPESYLVHAGLSEHSPLKTGYFYD
jgi:hypothetical protein